MRAILQYANVQTGPYKSAGIVRTRDEQDYRIEDITVDDRVDNPVLVGYDVRVRGRALEAQIGINNKTSYHWRLLFPKEQLYIYLGSRAFRMRHDGQLSRASIVYHDVLLNFSIDADEYDDYAAGQSGTLPAPQVEDGVILDDQALYI